MFLKLKNLVSSIFLANVEKFFRDMIFYFITLLVFISISVYFFLLSSFFKGFLLVNLIIFFIYLLFLNNLNKIFLSNFIFLVPKILEIAISALILASFRFLFIFEIPFADDILKQNFIILNVSCFLILILFFSFKGLQKLFSSTALVSAIVLIFFYFIFIVETAYAGTGKDIIIAADNKTSYGSTDEDPVATLTKILAENDISAETVFNTVINNNSSIKDTLPKDMLNKKGFESKEIFHNAIAFLTKDLVCFSSDISPDENVKVFMSRASLNDYIKKTGNPKPNFLAIFKDYGKWYFFKQGPANYQEVNEASAYFLNDPSFESYLEYVKDMPYKNLSLGDAVFKDNSTGFLEVLEYKSRDQKKPDYQFLEIKQHLNCQIFYHNYKEIWQRSSFKHIHYQSHSNLSLLNNYELLVSKTKMNLQNRKNFILENLGSTEARLRVLNNQIFPSLGSFLRKIK